MSAANKTRVLTSEASRYLDKLGWDDEIDRRRLWAAVGNFVLAKGHERRREMNYRHSENRPFIETELNKFFSQVYVPQFLTANGKARNGSVTMRADYNDTKQLGDFPRLESISNGTKTS